MRPFPFVALAGIALLGPVAVAPAQEPTRAPALLSTWTGCYVGGNIGGGWGTGTGDRGIINSGNATLNAGTTVPVGLGVKPSGVIGGGQVGCNYQTGSLVFGIETDIQGSGIHGTSTVFFPASGGLDASTTTGEERIDWFGTMRARFGFAALRNLLLYGTGGLAYGGVKSSATFVLTPASEGNYAGSVNDTRVGWTVGVGGEYAFAPNWSVRLEYLYVDLGRSNVRMFDPNRPGTFIDYSFRHRDNIVRAALNYKFN